MRNIPLSTFPPSVAYCSKGTGRTAVIRPLQTGQHGPCGTVCAAFKATWVNMFVCKRVCVRCNACVERTEERWKEKERLKEKKKEVPVWSPAPSRKLVEGVTIRSPSHSSRKADCAANCGLGGWRPTDRMESCNTKEKQFGSSTQ